MEQKYNNGGYPNNRPQGGQATTENVNNQINLQAEPCKKANVFQMVKDHPGAAAGIGVAAILVGLGIAFRKRIAKVFNKRAKVAEAPAEAAPAEEAKPAEAPAAE